MRVSDLIKHNLFESQQRNAEYSGKLIRCNTRKAVVVRFHVWIS